MLMSQPFDFQLFYVVVLLAEDSLIQDKMALHGIELQTVAEVAPIQIHPARVLSKLYSLLGEFTLLV